MARKVAEALGVEVEFSVIDWNNKLMELDSRTVDCLWNGMTITDEITGGASATNPYATNAQVVVLKADVAGDYQDAGEPVRPELRRGGRLRRRGRSPGGGPDLCVRVRPGHRPDGGQFRHLRRLHRGSAHGGRHDRRGHQLPRPDLHRPPHRGGLRRGLPQGSDLTDFINEQLKVLYDDGTIAELAEQYGISDNIVPRSKGREQESTKAGGVARRPLPLTGPAGTQTE